MQKFHSYGKLLISGEYVVLDGATALALPTKFGQTLKVKEIEKPLIKWRSLENDGTVWFEDEFQTEDIFDLQFSKANENNEVSKMLFLALHAAGSMNSEILKEGTGFEVITEVDFPRTWGLGTSSTLIANLAKWLQVNPFKLLDSTFGGSGYDVALGMYGTPLTFAKQGLENSILKTSFDPPFKDHLFFVHLNQKQDSRKAIEHYRRQEKSSLKRAIEKTSAITHSMITCKDLREFELLVEIHENLISQLLGIQKVKTRLFSEYPGAIKSLGGWGGDFVLVSGNSQDMDYFRRKGFNTILTYDDMILT
ncbi:GYDIA family GHMP kinase [Salinimicrobium sp. CAU 1759]